MGLMTEQAACQAAVHDLRGVQARVRMILRELYDSAPGYAGEVEAVKEATDNAIRVLSGEAPE